ncbi:AcrR family transcriptional regulator [Rhizobium aquaticum]|uniref:AcrR family transcriptional regulator n=1 Tax=Rhizobium aquaticum TaxID=1549636 RepID=A0ABV2J0I0_9HYPH
MSAFENLVTQITQVFFEHGYEKMTMSLLAQHCKITRRGLYHHFSSKEEALQAMIRLGNQRTRVNSIREGERLLAEKAPVLDIVTHVLDVRYGETRRQIALSPYALEINDAAFRICRPVMIEAAALFQADFCRLIERAISEGLFSLRPTVSVDSLVQMLCDGARGTNQSFVAPRPEEIVGRYRQMSGAILYGCVMSGEV